MEKIFHCIPISAWSITKAFCFCGLLFSQALSAQGKVQDSIKHHVVVLLDRSGSVDKESKVLESTASYVIQKKLKNVCFGKGMIPDQYLIKTRPLLQNGDYLSVLSFGFRKRNPDVDEFIQAIDFKKGNPVKVDSTFNQTVFSDLWKHIKGYGYEKFYDWNWTGLSFAGPHALQYLNGQNNPKNVGRTFVIIITDGEFNGLGDPNNEIKEIETYWDDFGTRVKNRTEIIPRYNEVREAFSWNRIYEYSSNPGRQKNNYKMEVMEYIPIQKTFAIEAILPLEPRFFFKRTLNDSYTQNLEIKPYVNPAFSVECMNLKLKDTSNNKLVWSKDFHQLDGSKKFKLEVAKPYKSEHLMVEAKFWVHFNDDAYGLHMLSPYGSMLQGKNGLNRMYPVVFEKNERILFGLIPLSDALYRFSGGFLGEEQRKSVVFWNIVLLLISALALYITIRTLIEIKK